MFIGHFGVGFGAKKITTTTSLGTLFLASQFVDLLWPIFLMLGIEKVTVDPGNTIVTPLNFLYYPFTHSLVGVLFWAILFALIYYLFRKNLKISILLAILVLSHWILDLITHRPDLPITIGSESTFVGLGLWDSLASSIIVESLIFVGGIYLFIRISKAKNKTGTYSLWGLIIFFVIIYIVNLFGPPPASADAIGYVGLAQWLLIPWAYWIDKNWTIKI